MAGRAVPRPQGGAALRVLTWEATESKGLETSWIMSGARSPRARGRAVTLSLEYAGEPYVVD
ncbi:hypothetical protein [Streptomyces mirabilis]|uniref:hypothetical protein n=1 Tax=Streptomyces mirabilis TaxID=68239 RepID=UPI0033B08EF1